MRQYEVTYIIAPSVGDEEVPALTERFSQLVSSQGGQVGDVNPWGKRRLAYEIAGHHEGYYVTMRFEGTDEVAREFERTLKLNEAVIRSLLVRPN